jgi:hypothetical protein
MPPPIKYERQLCEATIRFYEAECGAPRESVRFPEEHGVDRQVDCLFSIGERHFAIEHTIVEAFERQINSGKDFSDFAAPIVEAVEGRLPHLGIYYLTFPIEPCVGLHRRRHAAVQADIAAWCLAAAEEIHAEGPEMVERRGVPYHEGVRSTIIAGIPLTMSRRAWFSDSARHVGRFFVQRDAGPDVEDLRAFRLLITLEKKLEKLAGRRACGDQTILLLENRDVALSNHILVAQGLDQLLDGRPDRPCDILYVDVLDERDWTLWPIFRDGHIALETCDYVEFDGASCKISASN